MKKQVIHRVINRVWKSYGNFSTHKMVYIITKLKVCLLIFIKKQRYIKKKRLFVGVYKKIKNIGKISYFN